MFSPKQKYTFIIQLNRLPGTCWTNLVTWVEYGTPLREAFNVTPCVEAAAELGDCYCGKKKQCK